jgi:type IV secretion system protein VirD4
MRRQVFYLVVRVRRLCAERLQPRPADHGFAIIAVSIALSVRRARGAREVTIYGTARRAPVNEVRSAEMLGDAGVVLGKFNGNYLHHVGPEHVLCFAPTCSGKGVGLVVPTLLTWPASAILHNIRGENWQLTAGWRARFSRVLLFEPTNPASPGQLN